MGVPETQQSGSCPSLVVCQLSQPTCTHMCTCIPTPYVHTTCPEHTCTSYTHIFLHRCRYMYFCVYAGPYTFHMYACVHTCRHVQASMLSVYLLVFVYPHMCTHSLLASPFSSAVSPSLPHADLSPADSYLVLIARATLGTSKQGCTRV